jgi:hypothetical protein
MNKCTTDESWVRQDLLLYTTDLRKERITSPIPLVARPEGWVCGRSLAEISCSNLARGIHVFSCEYYMLPGAATGRSPVQRSHTVCLCVSLSIIRCINNAQHLP